MGHKQSKQDAVHDDDYRDKPDELPKEGSSRSSSLDGGDNSSSTSSNTLQKMRRAYADEFLARCDPVDPNNNFDLPKGVYICPWMPDNPQLEEYYECGNCGFGKVHSDLVECKVCGVVMEQGRSATRDHFIFEQHNLLAEAEQAMAEARQALKQSNHSKYLALMSKANELLDSLNDHDTFWKPSPNPEDFYNGPKDMKYWASRCETKSLPLFNAEVMRRPDIRCDMDVKKRHGNKHLDFGSQCFQASLLPSAINTFPGYSPCAIQTTWLANLDDSLIYDDDYCNWKADSRYRLGIAYTKEAAWSWNQRQTWRDNAKVYRPFAPHYSVPLGGVNLSIKKQSSANADGTYPYQEHGGPDADVWTMENQQLGPQIKPILDKLASQTNDCPIPRYQMIIDPNQFVRTRKLDGKNVWVPCEFDVAADGSHAVLVGGDRAHWMDTGTVDSVATPILSAALPLLAKLTKPHLLVEGQRLQVVVKAQSITVPKKLNEDDEQEYIGLWHVDGEHEPVVAIVLYYYDVDDALVGGNMEFLDRRPIAVLGEGDTSMPNNMPKGALRQALRPGLDEEGSQQPPLIPNCSVAIKTGTMLVFSNYQMAHRVLRMVNTSQTHAASRKFVALFVMDPGAERLVPARSHLAHSYLYQRALSGPCQQLPSNSAAPHDRLPEAVALLVMEFLGIVPSLKQRRLTRNTMLRSQLVPKSYLGSSPSMVCSTGNGCVTMLGWIDSMLTDGERHLDYPGSEDYCHESRARVNALNYPPTEVGRGLSEALSIPFDDLNNFDSYYDTIAGREQQLNVAMGINTTSNDDAVGDDAEKEEA